MNQPKRVEKCKILIANTPMDTDKVKVGTNIIAVIDLVFLSPPPPPQAFQRPDHSSRICLHYY